MCDVADDHIYDMDITSKATQNQGCPMCSGRRIVKSNCLASTYPEISKEFHPTKNGKITPSDFTPGTGKSFWWLCPEGHSYEHTPQKRFPTFCPKCDVKKVSEDRNFLALFPEEAKEWHLTKNGDKKPEDYMPSTHTQAWWQCSKNKEHEWESVIANKSKGHGCPICAVDNMRGQKFPPLGPTKTPYGMYKTGKGALKMHSRHHPDIKIDLKLLKKWCEDPDMPEYYCITVDEYLEQSHLKR